MAKKLIPSEIRQMVDKIVDDFNQEYYKDRIDDVSFFTEFRGKFLYLKRREYGKIAPVVRLTYSGKMEKWSFAIFKWSSETYDADYWMIPGSSYVDGTIEGALKAGMVSYTV